MKEALWAEAFVPFFEGAKTRKPNVKKLAQLLRTDEPLAPGFRAALAEVLNSRLPGNLACNWQLRPHFVGRRDRAARAGANGDRIIKEIGAARSRGLSVEKAIKKIVAADGITDKSASAVWKIWNEHQRWQRGPAEHLRKEMEKGAREWLERRKSPG